MLTDVRLGLLSLVCLALGGCGTLYVAQAARGQLQILTAREPIKRVLADPKTEPALKARLEGGARGARVRVTRARPA
jgi:predicted aminopeptidase